LVGTRAVPAHHAPAESVLRLRAVVCAAIRKIYRYPGHAEHHPLGTADAGVFASPMFGGEPEGFRNARGRTRRRNAIGAPAAAFGDNPHEWRSCQHGESFYVGGFEGRLFG